jgi:hypothetical protein
MDRSPFFIPGQPGAQLQYRLALSSRGLGHDPFTVVTGVRIPLGSPVTKSQVARSAWSLGSKLPTTWSGSSVGYNTGLSRRGSRVRVPSTPPEFESGLQSRDCNPFFISGPQVGLAGRAHPGRLRERRREPRAAISVDPRPLPESPTSPPRLVARTRPYRRAATPSVAAPVRRRREMDAGSGRRGRMSRPRAARKPSDPRKSGRYPVHYHRNLPSVRTHSCHD